MEDKNFIQSLLENCYVHDIEIYKNFFSDILLAPVTKEVVILILWDHEISEYIFSEIKNHPRFDGYSVKFLGAKQFISFLIDVEPYLIGYNSYNFDDPLLNAFICGYHRNVNTADFISYLHGMAKDSITSDSKITALTKFKSSDFIKTIDLMRVAGLDRIFKPLKQTAANLRHDIIQDLPIPFSKEIELGDIVNLIVYEFNDVLITEKLLKGIPKCHNSPTIPKTAYGGLLPAIDFRKTISDYFNIDFTNSNKSQIGEKLATVLYSKASNRKPKEFRNTQTKRKAIKYDDLIFDRISFKTKQLKDFLIKLKSLTYKPDEDKPKDFKFDFNFHGLDIVFAQGGLHGTHAKRKVFKATENVLLIDLDVGSFYPYLYWKYKIEPKHLPDFNKFVGDIIKLRLKYKAEGNKLFANGLKIAINRIYGGFSDDYGWLKDVQALLATTINGQLMLLMLIEELAIRKIPTYYANTDGITVVCKKEKVHLLNDVWKEWEKKLDLILERDDFQESYIRDVNNFLQIKTNGKFKLKGAYEYQSFLEKYGEFDLTGSYEFPIVSYAVKEYFVNGVSIDTTIKEHVGKYSYDGIFDFCIAKKSGKQFKNLLVNYKKKDEVKLEVLQQSVRYYISKSNNKLFKVKEKTDVELFKLYEKFNKDPNSVMYTYVLGNENTFDIKRGNVKGTLIRTFENGTKLYVFKRRKIDGFKKEWYSYVDVSVDRNITLFNDYFESADYAIDYDFYIKEAEKLIAGIVDFKPKEVLKTKSLF